MHTSSNMKYRDASYLMSTLATFGVVVALAGTTIATETNASTINTTTVQDVTLQTRYDSISDYSYTKNSTQGDHSVKNNLSMLRNMEISKLNDKILSIFSHPIVNHWIPADGFLDETCLFVTIENQDMLMSQDGYDFELDLYVQLEEEIAASKFFNMIALL